MLQEKKKKKVIERSKDWCAVGQPATWNTSIPYEEQVRVLAALLQIQLPVNMPGKAAEDGQDAWAPATHTGDLDTGIWLRPGPALVTAAI